MSAERERTEAAGPPETLPTGRGGVFETTHWSVVLAAGSNPSPASTAALERLCRLYWYPLYAHVRRRGYGEADAKDLTQGFFAHLLERQAFQRAAPARGRFRSFLLSALNYFLSDMRDRSEAQKRGGGAIIISIDAEAAEERYALEPVDGRSPDKIFERRWAMALLDQALARLRGEFNDAGKAGQFSVLSRFLIESSEQGDYADLARELGQSEEALRKTVQRLRKRYGELVREEISNTVAAPGDVAEELRYLCSLIREGEPG